LKGGHQAHSAKGEDDGADENQAVVFADALPDQHAADLGRICQAHSRIEFAEHLLGYSHGLGLPERPPVMPGCAVRTGK
jgi:hypothetical protein